MKRSCFKQESLELLLLITTHSEKVKKVSNHEEAIQECEVILVNTFTNKFHIQYEISNWKS